MKGYGKINMYLDILSTRDDGYHQIKSVMQSIELCDEVEIEKTASGIDVFCENPFVPNNEKNIAYKAAKAIIDRYDIKSGVKINIKKEIPVAAGLAGGSADAAATLLEMNNIFDLNISEDELLEIAASLGADVPFCLLKGTYLAEGIGEELTKLPNMEKYDVLLVKPDRVSVSTKWAYNQIDEEKYNKGNSEFIEEYSQKGDTGILLDNMYNIFQKPICKNFGIVKGIIEKLEGTAAKKVMMSGSGPTVFAIYDSQDECDRAKEIIDDKNFTVIKTKIL